MIKLYFIFIFSAASFAGFSQSNNFLPTQNFSVSMEGGVSLAFTDYKTQAIGTASRGAIEYYLYPASSQRISLGFMFGFQQLKGEEERTSMFTHDGTREIPPAFTTNIFSPGFFADYGYNFMDRFLVYGRLGISYNIFNPKDDNGNDAFGYSEGYYNQEYFTVIPEVGMKSRIDQNINISIAFLYSLPSSDYLDDVSASSNSDSYANVLLGISYSFLQPDYNHKKQLPDGVTTNEYPDSKLEEDEVVKQNDNLLNKTETDSKINEDSEANQQQQVTDPVTPESRINEILLPGDETFVNGTSKFRLEIYSELDNIVEIINRDPASKWRIEGHMDSQGIVAAIRKLSLDRARAVHDYFISKGIDSGRLRVYGLADNFPIGNNNTEEGRKMNRRIMIIKE